MGRSDSPLTSEGRRSSAALAETLRAERVARILASPLGRALATAEIYADALHARINIVESMAELGCGEWEGRLRREVVRPGDQLRNTWWERPPGGESCADGEKRVRPLVRELRSNRTETGILVVGHASVNRVFLKVWLDLTPEVALRIICPHDRVYLLGSDGGTRSRWTSGGEYEGLLLEEP
jgi:broad specificity phosphatase PhoE